MRILVTDGDNRAALAVTRSLGRAGHHVIVAEKYARSLAQSSRYCAARATYPDPTSASEDFIASLAELVRDQKVDILLPVADITTFLVTSHRDRFGTSCSIPFADAAIVERAADKVDIVDTALRLGVPVPHSVVVSGPSHVPTSDLEFPIVIKPWRSRIRTATGWASTAVSYATDIEHLRRDLASRPAHEFPVLLQERIVGPGSGLFACYHQGRAVALFSHRRLRERPPWGGVSVLSESTALSPSAAEYATRLLDELGWHGVAMVEFKHDVRDNRPKLMEINGRFWGSLQLAIDAGVDFPALLVQSAAGGRFDPQLPYRIGVRNRWFWGDVDSLLVSLFGRNPASPTSRADRVRAVKEFASLWGPDLYYDNPKWRDPWPWWVETRRWFGVMAQNWMSKRPHRAATQIIAPRTAASPALQTRLASGLDQIALDETGWNALVERSDTNSVFQTHQWTRSWWKTFGNRYESLFITASDASGVVGVAPLVIEHRASAERVARFLGDGRADYCDFLAGGRPEVLTAMFEALCDCGDWDVLELNNIPIASRTADILRAACTKAGMRIIADHQLVCPTLLVRGHEADALRILNKPSLRRPVNHFTRQGRLVSRNLTASADIEPFLDRFFAQHIARWQDTSSPSLFVNPRNQAFYRELTLNLADQGWLLFSVVEFNDQPIAFHYGFDYNGSVIWYKPSFDVAHAQRSPGLLLVRHLIGYALDQGRLELDFTVGDEPFKTRFTNVARTTVRVQVFRDSARYMYERSRRNVLTVMKRLARTSSVALRAAHWS